MHTIVSIPTLAQAAQSTTTVDLSPVLDIAAYAIYFTLGSVALYGVFCVILLVRRIAQKRFPSSESADRFLEEVRDRLKQKDDNGVAELCDSPPYWAKATPQLVLLGIANRHLGTAKLRRMLAEKFEIDVLSDLEYRTSWIATIVKSAPMLGLLGTVVGMINAFAGIADMQETGGVSKQLAADISFALFTTALGLAVAIPLVMAGNMIHVRIGKLQDSVQQNVGVFLDDLERTDSRSERRQV
jgi:biopolymer transport protein ExbB/TolQ